jgi:hypothetical protein
LISPHPGLLPEGEGNHFLSWCEIFTSMYK